MYSSRKSVSDHDLQYDFENHSLGSTMLTLLSQTYIAVTTSDYLLPKARPLIT